MSLDGRTILIVEDEPIIALGLEDKLRDRGAHPVLAQNYQTAEHMVRTQHIDGALLDINLHGQHSYPLARLLRERGTPFIFATGHGEALHPTEFADVLTIIKPYDLRELESALTALLSAQRPAPPGQAD